jgi:hypothetical protein
MIPRESKTNAAYGPDSDLYGAMEYIRRSQRQSGLTQKSNVPPPTPQPTKALFPQSSQETRVATKQRAFSFCRKLPDAGISPLFALLIHHFAG